MPNHARSENRKSIKDVTISPDERVKLYAVSRFMEKDFRKKCGLLLPFSTYFQDPFVAEKDPTKGIDDESGPPHHERCTVGWGVLGSGGRSELESPRPRVRDRLSLLPYLGAPSP